MLHRLAQQQMTLTLNVLKSASSASRAISAKAELLFEEICAVL